MSKKLIIIGGNKNYFRNLFNLIQSLRKEGKYTGDIIICDNSWKNGFFGLRRIDAASAFTKVQNDFFEKSGVCVVTIRELADKTGLDIKRVMKIYTEHHAHPLKFVYCTLISRMLADKYEKIAFCDGDVFCQNSFNLDFVKGEGIYVAGEECKISSTRFMSKWMHQVQTSSTLQQNLYSKHIGEALNLCTGFLAGTSAAFAATCELLWNLSEVTDMKFHNDQPLFDYAMHWLRIPYNLIGINEVCHLANIDQKDLFIDYDSKTITVHGVKPALVHYHGPLGPKIFNSFFPDSLKA